jgi:CRISPR system Cascade subunit CasC
MLIQSHILQNYAPSNLNRDENNTPKKAKFGTFDRGRVSSQSLKRAIRTSQLFEEAFKADGLLAERTRRLPCIVEAELRVMAAEEAIDDETIRAIVARVHEIGKGDKDKPGGGGDAGAQVESEDEEKPKGKAKARAKKENADAGDKDETRQLIFLAPNEHRPLAQKLLAVYRKYGAEQWSELEMSKITHELGRSLPRSVDIAMFGRMTTTDAFEDVQAAVQVAHAFSTHRLAPEVDYYTAFDERANKTAMIGDTEFNSCAYYKYLNVFWEGLVKNLGDDVQMARKVALKLLEAALLVQPTGKQNPFAHHQLPDFALVEVRQKNLPVSYANAFLKPARASDDISLMEASINQLADYVGRVSKTYNLSDQRAFLAVPENCAIPEATRQPSLDDFMKWLDKQLQG